MNKSLENISDETKFEEAKQYYKTHKKEILEKYNGKYIAMIGQEIVDYDTDFSSLVPRLDSKYGFRKIFIPFVSEHERIVLLSPHLSNP